MDYFDPLNAVTWLAMLADGVLLPLAEGDLSSVPAEFVKYFLIVATFLVGNYLMLTKSRAANGKAEDPLHLKSPIETRRSPSFADKLETSDAIRALNTRLEHLETRISKNYIDIVEAGQLRTESLTKAMNVMKDEIVAKIDQSMKEAYSRINEQDTRLSRVEGRLSITKPTKD